MRERLYAPSDQLQTVYERRAELQYAAPVDLPDRRADRKFSRMLDLVAETLPADSLLDAGCGDGFSFTCDEVVAAVQSAGLEVEHVETFRFHLDGISAPLVGRFLNAIDEKSPPHRWGDIVAIVARKPSSQ